MDKTVVVKVADHTTHTQNIKRLLNQTKTTKLMMKRMNAVIGDTVRIIESKPISGSKRWVVESIVEKAK